MSDFMERAFLKVWEGEGKDYRTRAEIARYFGKSAYWVQWMYVKTGAKPRTRAPSVKLREETGVDDRMKYIEIMADKSAMNAAVKKLIKRTMELRHSKPYQRDYLKRIVYLNKLIDTVDRHVERIRLIDPEWVHIGIAERALANAQEVYLIISAQVEDKT